MCVAVMEPSLQLIGGDVTKRAGMVDDSEGGFRQRYRLWRDLRRVPNPHPYKPRITRTHHTRKTAAEAFGVKPAEDEKCGDVLSSPTGS